MKHGAGARPPTPPSGDARGSLHAQILATEHWSLLATRSMTWTEIFSRTATYLTIVSATVIALSLVAQGTGFGRELQVFAVIVLPVVLFVGIATYLRLVEADVEDAWLVIGMNRLRHAYLDLAPELEGYFVTSDHDDEPGMLRTYAFRDTIGLSHWLSGSPVIVGLVNAVVGGVLGGALAHVAGASTQLQVAVGLLVGAALAAAFAVLGYRRVVHMRHRYHPSFPGDPGGKGVT